MQSGIGLHASGETLRLAEVVRSGDQLRVTKLQVVTDSLPPASAPLNGDTRICVASLPSRDVLTRAWLLPDAEGSRLRAITKHRLEADLPIPLEQLVWAIRCGQLISGQRLVLAQAARKVRTQEYLEHIGKLGLALDALTSEHEALAGLVQYGMLRDSNNSSGALVLANAHEWLVAIIDGGLVRAVRRIACSSGQVELAARELRQSLTAELGPERIGQIWWLEDGSNLAEIAVDGLLGLPVTPATFPNLCDAAGQPLRAAEIFEYGPAIGLALAGLFQQPDLLRLGGETKVSLGGTGRINKLLQRPYRLTGAACVLLLLAVGTHVSALRYETTRMTRELDAMAVPASADLERKIQSMQRLQRYRLDVEGIVAEICRTIPDPVLVSSVQLSRERRLIIKGTSKDPKAVFTFADALRKSPRFVAVNPERAAPTQGGDFTVSAELTGVEKLAAAGVRGGTWR